jgi:hypothetical protein
VPEGTTVGTPLGLDDGVPVGGIDGIAVGVRLGSFVPHVQLSR